MFHMSRHGKVDSKSRIKKKKSSSGLWYLTLCAECLELNTQRDLKHLALSVSPYSVFSASFKFLYSGVEIQQGRTKVYS